MILVGDSKDQLKFIDNDSVDSIVTDPPYGYSFMGKEWDKALPDIEIWRECLRVMKPGAFAFVMSAPRQDVLCRMMLMLEEVGFKTDFTSIYWTYASGFPKANNIGKAVDKKLGGKVQTFKGFNYKGDPDGKLASRQEALANYIPHTPDTDQAKTLDGSYGGFQPKPAVEVIIVVQKPPTESTQVGQALANGKGVTWLDDCRIPYKGESPNVGGRGKHGRGDGYGFQPQGDTVAPNTQGRFPANLVVCDKALGESYSRFFSLDAWWDHLNVEGLEPVVQDNLPFLIVPKASKKEKNAGCSTYEIDNSDKYNGKFPCSKADRFKNNHPTVKPVKLMSYLITLGSRPGDTILDPFCGSGSTGCAAVSMNRKFIGIELDTDYIKIADGRIEYYDLRVSM